MKKITILILLILIISTTAFAQKGKIVDEENKPLGLQKAIITVSNENAYQKLNQNFNRFQERNNISNCNSSNCQILISQNKFNNTQIDINRQVKAIGLFKVNAKESYETNEEGKELSRVINFWQFMYQTRLTSRG